MELIETSWEFAPTFDMAIYSLLVENHPDALYLSPDEHVVSFVIRGKGLVQIQGHFHRLTEDQLYEFVAKMKRRYLDE